MEKKVTITRRGIYFDKRLWERLKKRHIKEESQGESSSISSLIRRFCVEGLERREGGTNGTHD